jgi:ABC-type multidrug transport system fused ATPase/permease subunit
MIESLKELYKVLSPSHRKKIFFLQIWIILMSFAEVLSVLSIGPFMAIVADNTLIDNDKLILKIYEYFEFSDPNQFLIYSAMIVLALLVCSASISIFTIWCLAMQGSQIGADLSNRLFKFYMHQNWIFHAESNSSVFINKIMTESNRITSSVLIPLLQMYAKVVMTMFMICAITIYNPIASLIGLAIFSISYFLLYQSVRVKLQSNGQIITEQQAYRFKTLGESFGGIKDILLNNQQQFFLSRFFGASNKYAYVLGNTTALGQVPRYLMELIAFGSIIALILGVTISGNNNLSSTLPTLAIFALAGFKLLPAFQLIYASLASIQGNLPAFENIKEELISSQMDHELILDPREIELDKLRFENQIRLKNVSFQYPKTDHVVLYRVDLKILHNHTVGIVGASGSGKSTLIDIILGLISPTSGEFSIDNQRLDIKNIYSWQSKIGFVPQHIFLSDASIKENIAFGIAPSKIDDDKVLKAIALANLDSVIDNLPFGIETRVGERGVQLSGGQRQRVGIARALYENPPVLILDEATSALDGLTEKSIMEAIDKFSGKKTIIIIAHRLATIRNTDSIVIIDQGSVSDTGSYDELVMRNKDFKKMVENA